MMFPAVHKFCFNSLTFFDYIPHIISQITEDIVGALQNY